MEKYSEFSYIYLYKGGISISEQIGTNSNYYFQRRLFNVISEENSIMKTQLATSNANKWWAHPKEPKFELDGTYTSTF